VRFTSYLCHLSDKITLFAAPEKPRLRSQSPGDGKDKDAIPSNVLMFRGLDYRTTEEQVQRRLRDLTKVPIKDVRLITDKYTNKSRGFCFVEVTSVAEGKELMNKIQRLDPPFEISNRKVTVTYQREPGEKNQAADAAIAAAQWSATTKHDVPPTVETQNDTANPNPATAAQGSMPQTIGSYVWDEKSGYYFDQSSGLYYDPKTKYYYNPTDEKYYYWDDKEQKYETVPATSSQMPDQQTAATSETPSDPAEKGKSSNIKATKAMNAKKIQKDMERWAKAKNRQQAKANPPKVEPEPPQPEAPVVQQSGNSIALKIAQDYADPVYQQTQQPGVPAPPPPSIFPITNIATAPVVMTDEQINRKYEDLSAIACLLCKRKFPSVDNLRRHQELSDLHKTSLAAERQKMSSAGYSDSSVLDYRDRAAERRNKFGADPAAPPAKFMRR